MKHPWESDKYSDYMDEKKMTAFIKDAWQTHEENKHVQITYGLNEEVVHMIVKSPKLYYFFEGLCYQTIQLDPHMKYLKSSDFYDIFRNIAKIIQQDKKFRKFIEKMEYNFSKEA